MFKFKWLNVDCFNYKKAMQALFFMFNQKKHYLVYFTFYLFTMTGIEQKGLIVHLLLIFSV